MDNTIPGMNPPADLVPLAAYPGFAINPAGEVWRLKPTERGTLAGCGPRALKPTTHPRGYQWYVYVTREDGKRIRASIKKLVAETFPAARRNESVAFSALGEDEPYPVSSVVDAPADPA